jgi:two-component system phosphate regulon sensor histidine kinase PhoR
MHPKRLVWYIFPWYLVIILVSLAIVTGYSTRAVKDFHFNMTSDDLEARAVLFEEMISEKLEGPHSVVDGLCKELGSASGTRITVILPDGRVIGDSDSDPESMENHGDRPEFIRALAGMTGSSIRYSDTLRERFMYVAVPVRFEGGISGAVRASMPLTALDRSLSAMYLRITISGILVAIAAGFVSMLVARRISRPVEEIKKGVVHFASNDLSYRLPQHELEEIGELAGVINAMAGRLEDRIETVERQRNEQEAIFAGMVEGLLVVDENEKVVRLNPAASAFLGVDIADAEGRMIQEVVRNPYLQKFVRKTLASALTVEEDITLRNDRGELYVQGHGVQLLGPDGRLRGGVIVLNNVTRLRRLENLRKDFVANVSHELRTPITSIKGFVETLLDGALRDPVDGAHFLKIIGRQAERMDNIIEDLLLLSGVERGLEESNVRVEKVKIEAIIRDALEVCEYKAKERKIRIDVDCAPDIVAMVNEPLLEQAVVNLLDNAIKYSDKGGSVEVNVSKSADGITIEVRDEGCGIDREDVPRLFERFYRVDKARSRKLGGTGLGLAIVKHIMQAHGGSVTVASTPGEGSVFTLHLPDSLS